MTVKVFYNRWHIKLVSKGSISTQCNLAQKLLATVNVSVAPPDFVPSNVAKVELDSTSAILHAILQATVSEAETRCKFRAACNIAYIESAANERARSIAVILFLS